MFREDLRNAQTLSPILRFLITWGVCAPRNGGHNSLNILVEGLLNYRPRVCFVLAEIGAFGPPRATRTSLLLLLLLLLLMSPSDFIKTLNPRELPSKITKFDKILHDNHEMFSTFS